ncbi:MAG: oxidoreductase [Chitinophagia bacterium]|nr:oxidoreductase [Chitinophagia bacterium]
MIRNVFMLTFIPAFLQAQQSVRLITLDPGHFHAALVQKSMYPGVDSTVQVYAPGGPDLQMHLSKINGYNAAKNSPTHWKEQVYTGKDFFSKMINERKGNVVVLAGNNQLKTDYILQSVQAGFHVFSDKPMAITSEGFQKLQKAFQVAAEKKVLLYDIMTERYEISTQLQRALSMQPQLFGQLEKGTPDNPAVTKESVHHFFKYVSGAALTRPAWFFDVEQEGEGIVDVTTHLVDLVQWECFPEKIIQYEKDIKMLSAKSWNTVLSQAQLKEVTQLSEVPAYLNKYKDASGNIQVKCNGEINYQINGVHARVSVIWNYKAPEGTGDTHYSILRGTKCNLVIRQGAEQKFQPTLYIEPSNKNIAISAEVAAAIAAIQGQYPGISVAPTAAGWEVIIPASYKEGHEAHFARVTEKYLDYLKNIQLPAWEVPNMLAKYYVTTQARKLANKKQ